jgi:ABC-2 type transport system ATP-binding protein
VTLRASPPETFTAAAAHAAAAPDRELRLALECGVTVRTATPVVVRDLRKRYGGRWALRGIDLDVEQGEVLTLLGPNGAGKTTTVEILEGVRRRTGGEVAVLGHDPARDSRELRARVGVVPQSTGAFLDLTPRELVGHFAVFYPAPLPVDHVLEIVGLADERDAQSASLSGGQRRRLDIALGIIGDPELLFLDEPTTGLDPQARRATWELVRRFAEDGKTIVLTTHYLDEAEALADRAAVIIGGRIVKIGPVGQLGDGTTTPPTVSFARSGPIAGLAPPPLPDGSQMVVSESRIEVRSATPTAVLATLIGWAGAAGITELPELSVHRPTLEDIYLALIEQHHGEEGGVEP